MSHLTRRFLLTTLAALCLIAAPAFAEGSGPRAAVAPTAPAAGAGTSSAAVTVQFTVRPVIVLVVDGNGSPTQLWTNIPGTPTSAELGNVQARLDSPRGAPVALDAAARAQLPAILADAGWGRQGLVWHQG